MHKIFLSNPELFTVQIAGIVMVFTLVKLNDGFMITIGSPNTLREGHGDLRCCGVDDFLLR